MGHVLCPLVRRFDYSIDITSSRFLPSAVQPRTDQQQLCDRLELLFAFLFFLFLLRLLRLFFLDFLAAFFLAAFFAFGAAATACSER